MVKIFEYIGRLTLGICEEVGRMATLFYKTILWIFRPPLGLRNLSQQMLEIGNRSMPVVTITATSTGMVFALQTYYALEQFQAEVMVGQALALALTRELAPVLAGLMVAGRTGAAIAAELGTMAVTEQIDALNTLAVNPVKFLIVPRVIAGLIMLPILTIYADAIGLAGGYVIGVKMLDLNGSAFLESIYNALKLTDITSGLYKSAAFGVIITFIGCYQGFYTMGGAEGVGKATTRSVVLSCMMILVVNFFLTKLLMY
jgi:phospholipid/cholesterol/gamma-HCH transport system permease protein